MQSYFTSISFSKHLENKLCDSFMTISFSVTYWKNTNKMSFPLGAIRLKQIPDAVEIRTCCENWYMKCIKLKHAFWDSEYIPKKYMIWGAAVF